MCLQSTAVRVYNEQQSYESHFDCVFPATASQELVYDHLKGKSARVCILYILSAFMSGSHSL